MLVPSPAGASPLGATATYSISGTVRDASGAPLAGIWVYACVGTDGMGPWCPNVATESDGRWSVGDLPADTYRIGYEVWAWGQGLDGWYATAGFTLDASAATPIPIASADVTGIDLTYPPMYAIRGKVVGPAAEPVEGATVGLATVADLSLSGVTATTTGADGMFSIAAVPGTYHLSVYTHMSTSWLDGWYTTPESAGKPAPVVVTNADVTGIVIRLERAAVIEASVVGSKKPRVDADMLWPHACSTATTCEFARPPMIDPEAGVPPLRGQWASAVHAGTYRIYVEPYD